MKVYHSANSVNRTRSGSPNRVGVVSDQLSRRVLAAGPEKSVPFEGGRPPVESLQPLRWTNVRDIESDFPDNITARRNVLAALWAGKLMGLAGEDLATYARNPRFVSQNDKRILGMLEADLRREGVSLSTEEIQRELSRFHRVALHQSCATD